MRRVLGVARPGPSWRIDVPARILGLAFMTWLAFFNGGLIAWAGFTAMFAVTLLLWLVPGYRAK